MSPSLGGGTPVHYLADEQNGWQPDLDDIRAKVTPRTKAIVVINPNNPTGAVYSREVLEGIAEIILAILKNENWLTRGVKNVTGIPRPIPDERALQAAPWVQDLAVRFGASPTTAATIVWRLGFAIRYLPPHVRQMVGARDSATLVRGEDRCGHFELERAPERDLSPEVLAYHRQLRERRMQIMMRPT